MARQLHFSPTPEAAAKSKSVPTHRAEGMTESPIVAVLAPRVAALAPRDGPMR